MQVPSAAQDRTTSSEIQIKFVPITIIYMKLYYNAQFQQSLTITYLKCRIHINNKNMYTFDFYLHDFALFVRPIVPSDR